MQYLEANTLYYTFSTVAQAGAGAFAFVSAFVLYRLQTVDHRMTAAASHIASVTTMKGATSSAQGYIAGRQYDKLMQNFEVSMQVIQNQPSLLSSWNLLVKEKDISEQLIAGFKTLIWPTALLLASSVFSLCLVELIVQSVFASFSLLLILSSSFSVLLFIQGRLLLRCLS